MMTFRSLTMQPAFLVFLPLTILPGSVATVFASAPGAVTFESQVRPILKAHCFHCHGEGDKKEGGLDVRLRRFLIKGGDSGAAISPGQPGNSLLLQRLRDGEMPPGDKQKLTAKEIRVIERWIASGAKTARPEPEKIDPAALITDEERRFWAFQPVRRPAVPAVRHRNRVRTPIDAFLLARLEQHGLGFSPEADRRTLIRRATFDLHGLPPTPEEIEAFVNDPRPDAYERLIERLLASPRYGERWGRHWLDIAGYADSEGYTSEDPERKWAWKYRDYVIRAFNADKPFDQFLCEQLAGDEMLSPPYRNLKPADIDKLVATGFLRMAPDGTASRGVNQTEARNQVIADTLQILGSALLGLSVGCAQCHDHRYDPIPQTDYYHLRAVFEPAFDTVRWRTPGARLISLYTDADRAEAARIEAQAKAIDQMRLKKQAEYIERTFQKELAKLPAEMRDEVRTAYKTPAAKRTDRQKQLLRKYPSVNVTAGSLYLYDRKAANELKEIAARAAKLRATKPPEEFVRALTEVPGRVPVTRFFFRGDPKQPRQEMTPAALSVLQHTHLQGKGDTTSGGKDRRQTAENGVIPPNDLHLPTTGRRLAYARWLTSGRHPLVGRVLVNRVWLHHFGTGLVNTPSDFGRLGERPSHPQLLDWLAAEFVAPESSASKKWSLKHLHRLIMFSAAYRQQSRRRPELNTLDPDNRLYGRMSIRRLEAESLRDAVLMVCGRLRRKMFGPPVPVMEDEVGRFVIGRENKNGENRPGAVIPLHGEEYRRSIYVQVRRSRPLAVLSTFDAPRMEPNCTRRNSSTVTPQSLMLMNDDFVIDSSRVLAARLRKEVGENPARQIERAWLLVYGRPPRPAEQRAALQFLREQQAELEQRQTSEVSVQSAGTTKISSKKTAGKKPASATKQNARQLALASLCQALLSSNEFLYID